MDLLDTYFSWNFRFMELCQIDSIPTFQINQTGNEFQFYLLFFSDVIQAIILYTVGFIQQSVVGRICGG